MEDTHALVSPQLDQVVVLGDGSWVRLGNTLEDLGHITQVVSVMRLGWGRSESLTGLLIGGDGSTDHAVLLTLDTLTVSEFSGRHEHPIHDGSKDSL